MKIFINDVIYLSMCYHLHWKNQREFQTDISHDETGTYVSDVNGSEWSLKLSYSLMSRRTALSSQSYVSSSCSIVTQDIDLIRASSITSRWPPPPLSKNKQKIPYEYDPPKSSYMSIIYPIYLFPIGKLKWNKRCIKYIYSIHILRISYYNKSFCKKINK